MSNNKRGVKSMKEEIRTVGHRIKGKFHDVIGNLRDNIDYRNQMVSLKKIKDSLYYLTRSVSKRTDNDAHKRATIDFCDRFFEELYLSEKANPEVVKESIIILWKHTSSQYKAEHKELFFQMMDLAGEDYIFGGRLWRTLPQKLQEEMLIETIDRYQENETIVTTIWQAMDQDLVKENTNLWLAIIKKFKENPYMLTSLWILTNEQAKQSLAHLFPELLEAVKEKPYDVDLVWKNLPQEFQKMHVQLLPEIFRMLKKEPYSEDVILRIWSSTESEAQKEIASFFPELYQMLEEDETFLTWMWNNTTPEILIHYGDLLPKIIKKCLDDPEQLLAIWSHTPAELQKQHKELLLEMSEKAKQLYRKDIAANIWMATSFDVIAENEEILREAISFIERDLIVDLWRKASKEQQIKNKNFFTRLRQEMKVPSSTLASMWLGTCKEVQLENKNELLKIMVDLASNGYEYAMSSVWRTTDISLLKAVLPELLEQMKNRPSHISTYIWNDSPEALKLWYIGQGKAPPTLQTRIKQCIKNDNLMKEDGTILLPDKLKLFLSQDMKEEEAQEILKNLPNIIQMWPQIERAFQYRKASTYLNARLEIRNITAKDVLSILQSVNRPKPQNISAEEFERTKGSEKVGNDIQYTVSTSTAVQRAHTVAKKMDEAGPMKAFPDFSVSSSDGQMVLKCLHPQDKSAILLGFDVGCCFRPNGNADNKAQSEYSLLQYCTTTPYGGVLRVESKDGSQVYMGTPVLTSGNMMIFHSYETAITIGLDDKARKEKLEQWKKANELLVDAAKKAIESSNGTLNIVLMTDLHTRRRKIRHRR